MSSRRKSRELALHLFYQQEFNGYPAQEISRLFWELNPVDAETRSYAQFLFSRFNEHQDEIDDRIRGHSRHWRLERMASVDRNVLRVAVTELLYADTPDAVVIDEALEIARRYSTEESSEFVNGVLDAVKESLRPGEAGEAGEAGVAALEIEQEAEVPPS